MKFTHPLTLWFLSLCLVLFAGQTHASAQHAFPLPDYNLVVLGDLESNSEVEGTTFVGGNLNGPSSNYGTRLVGLTDALVVGGDINGNPKNLFGNAVVGGSANAILNFNNGGSLRSETVDVSSISQSLLDASNHYRSMSSNSIVEKPGTQPGPMKFKAQVTGGTAVFDISIADFFSSKVQQIEFELNGADKAIINVSGTSGTWNAGGNFVGSSATREMSGKVLWNFYEATSLDLQRQLIGALLAPNAHVTNGTPLKGGAFVSSMTQNGEVHVPPAVVVPTPTAALASLGGLMVLGLRRRRSSL